MSLEQKQKSLSKSDLVKLAAEQKAKQIANGTYVAPFVSGTYLDHGLSIEITEKVQSAAAKKVKKPQA